MQKTMTDDTSETASIKPAEVSASFHTSTETFRIAPSAYLKIGAEKSLPFILGCLAIPLTGCLIGAVFDIRWAFVGVILATLVYPAVIAYVYYTRLLTPEAHRAVSPKKIEFHAPDRIDIVYVTADEESEPISSETIRWQTLESAIVSGNHMLISIKNCRNPLVVPLDSFPRADDVDNLCSMIGSTACRQA